MSDTVKLIIEISKPIYDRIKYLEPNADTMLDNLMRAVQNGTPLDDVKAEIETLREGEQQIYGKESWNFVGKCLEIIDECIGEAESEDKE